MPPIGEGVSSGQEPKVKELERSRREQRHSNCSLTADGADERLSLPGPAGGSANVRGSARTAS